MPDLRFDDRVAVVTGAGRGIGREEALLLGARGAKVVVNDWGRTGDGKATLEHVAEEVAAEIRAAGGYRGRRHQRRRDGGRRERGRRARARRVGPPRHPRQQRGRGDGRRRA